MKPKSPPNLPSPQPLLEKLGRRVRARRALLDLTLGELADRSGVSARYLSDLEAGKGNISVVRLAAIGRALDVSVSALLRDEERPSHSNGASDDPHEVDRSRIRATIDGLDDHELEELYDFLKMRRTSPESFEKIALIGLRGAGKTTVGSRLARKLKVPFVELDQRIEEAAGMSLANLFSIHGERYYRRLEREVLSDVVALDGRVILAAGGGIVTHPETYSLLAGSCFTIWLEATPDDHWNRVVAQGDQRPMRGKPKAMAELRAILAARRPLYARAHRRIDTSSLGLQRTVATIAESIATP